MDCKLPPPPVTRPAQKRPNCPHVQPQQTHTTETQNAQARASVGNVTVNVVMRPAKLVQRRPLSVTQTSIPMRRFTLGVLAGFAPSRYTISSTSCANQTCTANVKRRWVFDAGALASYRVSSFISVGAVGTFQGSFYGLAAFHF